MNEPFVEQFMTHCPHTIGQEQPLNVAHQMMREHHIRHLPVVHDGKLVGMLSQRDLHFMESHRNVDPERMTVSEAMTRDTYAIGPRCSLRKVAAEMADHRYGSAVIVDREHVVGILTTVDGMRALALVLSEQRRAMARTAVA